MRRYLVTGASRGIGRAIAARLSSGDTHLLIHGRDEKALAETAEIIKQKGGQSSVIIADLSASDGCEKLLESVGDGSIDMLVNNAGVGIAKPVEELTLEDLQKTLAVNVTAPFLITQGLLRQMKRGSSIVNILSTASKNVFTDFSVYCMSKFALKGFSDTLREELRPRGIRVIGVYPGSVDTSIWDNIPGEWPRERMMKPEDVAEAVAYAISCPASVLVEDITIGNLGGAL